jgi:hypothetical protein
VNIVSCKLIVAQCPPARHILIWIRQWRDIIPRLMLASVLLLLGQLAGRTDYHPTEGMTSSSSIVDSDDLTSTPLSIQPFAPSTPTNPRHLPQPHIIWHHTHCEFAPALTIILLISPFLIVLPCFISALQLQQITITPITPPPQIMHV